MQALGVTNRVVIPQAHVHANVDELELVTHAVISASLSEA